jgi:hypothetical protein
LASLERFSDGDFCGGFALELGDQRTESPDHIGDGEQPAILGQDLQEIRGDAADTGLGENGFEGLGLRIGCKDWLRTSRRKSGLSQKGGKLVEVRLNGIDGFLVARQFKQAVA